LAERERVLSRACAKTVLFLDLPYGIFQISKSEGTWMSHKIIASLLTVILISVSVQAKTSLSDWGKVQKLSLGSKIAVSTKKGERFEGELKYVDSDTLTLLVRMSRSARQAVEIRREDVSEVRKPKSRLLSTVLGAGIGLGVGIAVGAGVDARSSGEDPGLGKLLFGFLGVLGGTTVGGALPMKGKKIYVAP
jgi:small nuclear ribonucleoprotein (snRNP)-like protein